MLNNKFLVILIFLCTVIGINIVRSQQLITEYYNFEDVQVLKIPTDWKSTGNGWGVLTTDKNYYSQQRLQLILNSNYDFNLYDDQGDILEAIIHGVEGLFNLNSDGLDDVELVNSPSGQKYLYCGTLNYNIVGKSTKRLKYNKSYNSILVTEPYNEKSELLNTNKFDFSFNINIPSIKGNGKHDADYFKIFIIYDNDESKQIYLKDINTNGWEQATLQLKEYIDKRSFRIMLMFNSNHKKTAEGVYLDDIKLDYELGPYLNNVEIYNSEYWINDEREKNKISWNSNYSGKVNLYLKYGIDVIAKSNYGIENKSGINTHVFSISELDNTGDKAFYYVQIEDFENGSIIAKSKEFNIFNPAKIVFENNPNGLLKFDETKIGQTITKEIIVSNIGELDANINVFNLSDFPQELRGNSSSESNCNECFKISNNLESFIVKKKESISLQISYSPLTAAYEYHTFVLNYGTKMEDQYGYKNQIAGIVMQGLGKLASNIGMSKEIDEFGNVNIGKKKKNSYLFSNYGDERVKVTLKIAGSSYFSIEDFGSLTSFYLDPKPEVQTVNTVWMKKFVIVFKPESLKEYKGKLIWEAEGRELSSDIIGYGIEDLIPPTFFPPSGIYEQEQYVSINCASKDASITYTIDGTTPTKNSPIFTDRPIHVINDLVIKAMVYEDDESSPVTTSHYSISNQRNITDETNAAVMNSLEDKTNSLLNSTPISNLQVLYPSSSIIWEKGSGGYHIDWSANSYHGQVELQLYNGSKAIGDALPAMNTGQCNIFNVPQYINQGSNFRIKISDISNPSSYTYSDYFTIKEKGSYEESIPEYIRREFAQRPIRYVADLSFNSTNLKVTVFDHGAQDGDLISLYVNGESVFSNHYLTRSYQSKSVTLSRNNVNEVFLFAHNLGTLGENTVALILSDGYKNEKIVLKSNLGACEGIIIRVK